MTDCNILTTDVRRKKNVRLLFDLCTYTCIDKKKKIFMIANKRKIHSMLRLLCRNFVCE